jgi:hypothetical protein
MTVLQLPNTQSLSYYAPEEGSEIRVEFRLVYKGSLPAEGRSGGRSREKQNIRKIFHPQLAELWKRNDKLVDLTTIPMLKAKTPPNQVDWPGPDVDQVLVGTRDPNAKPWIDHVADDHEQFGYRFVPLIRRSGGFTCSLDILFLRRDDPGKLISGGGDIDNRIKVLFDGLKMPSSKSDLAGDVPGPSETPFFCLLEDDSLITSIAVTTDRLLLPMDSDERTNDVHLIIHVKVSDPNAIFTAARLL